MKEMYLTKTLLFVSLKFFSCNYYASYMQFIYIMNYIKALATTYQLIQFQ